MGHPEQQQKPSSPPIRESEALFRTLLDGTFEGIFIHDHVIRYANAAAAEITGRPREALIGMAMRELHLSYEHDRSIEPGAFREPAEGLTYGPFQFVGVGPTGRRATIEAQGKTIFYDGRWLWMSAFRDVTPFQRALDELERRVSFEDLVTGISASFIHLRPDEVDAAIDRALQSIARFEGVDRSYVYLLEGEHMRGINIWAEGLDVHNPWKGITMPVDEFGWAIDKLRRGENVVYDVVEKYRDHPDGPEDPARSRARSSLCVPMFASGELIGYVGFDALREAQTWKHETIRLLRTVGYVFASALERKRVQQELAHAYATMEQTVEERTRELRRKHAQLVHAEKMAALGQLVAGVAHEINTPLGAIRSNTDTLMRTMRKLTDKFSCVCPGVVEEQGLSEMSKLLSTSEKLNDINTQAVDRIVGIVSSLRQFARLDQAEIDNVDLHAAIDNTLVLVHHEYKHRIAVHKDYGELPLVECHPDQINQVFMNLMVNAGQAIEGRGEVFITTRAEGDHVRVELRDTGKGMTPELLARIFDPGFTTKGVGVGTGLGLSIVHGIVEEHGGRIEVQSEPDEGATFTLVLPVKHPADHDH
ncbi:MAG: ATP-binding protein [Myxococcales bacterium]|jgi:PAS domain S-box-containing protein